MVEVRDQWGGEMPALISLALVSYRGMECCLGTHEQEDRGAGRLLGAKGQVNCENQYSYEL